MTRIVTVYVDSPRREDREARDLALVDMSYIRWLKVSDALLRLGHSVEMAVPDEVFAWTAGDDRAPAVPRVPLSGVIWEDYDVVKTLFHVGFETLERYGGAEHPFIISKLGSVVGPTDGAGIFFYGKVRERLYETQCRLAEAARYVTLLSPAAEELWATCFGARGNVLQVPGGVDAVLPSAGSDPYPVNGEKRCLFAGNIYDQSSQPEANEAIVAKLNRLGELLAPLGFRLYLLGAGDRRRLDSRFVGDLGQARYEDSWDYLRCADVGVVVAAGTFMHNNESSKVYHYLRAGLPVVSEAGFPNDSVVATSGLGHVVDNGCLETMARAIAEAAPSEADREAAVQYILENHTWDQRVRVYDQVFRETRKAKV